MAEQPVRTRLGDRLQQERPRAHGRPAPATAAWRPLGLHGLELLDVPLHGRPVAAVQLLDNLRELLRFEVERQRDLVAKPRRRRSPQLIAHALLAQRVLDLWTQLRAVVFRVDRKVEARAIGRLERLEEPEDADDESARDCGEEDEL